MSVRRAFALGFAATWLAAGRFALAAELRVALTPDRDPDGRLWSIELRSAEPDELLGTYATALDGTWSRRGLPAKLRVSLVVKTEAGQPWWKSEKPIALEEEVTEARVALGLVKADGTLTWGGGPLRAELTFTDARVGTRVVATSHEDGTFDVALPRNGDWDVRVLANRPGVKEELRAEVEEDHDGRFHVAIALVADDIRGEVLDEDGKQMPSMWVILRCRCSGEPKYEWTDAQGLFRFARPGLAKYLLTASRGKGEDRRAQSADGVEIEYRPREGAPFVTLIARPRKEIHGRLVDASGGAVRRAIVQQLVHEGDDLGAREVRIDDSKGRFTFSVSPTASTRCVAVGGPGLGIAPDLQPLADTEEEQTVVVGRTTGVLELHAPPRANEAGIDIFFRNGCWTSAWVLSRYAATPQHSETDGQRLPVAPGSWTFCRIPPSDLIPFSGGEPGFARCATALVPPGGLATATLP